MMSYIVSESPIPKLEEFFINSEKLIDLQQENKTPKQSHFHLKHLKMVDEENTNQNIGLTELFHPLNNTMICQEHFDPNWDLMTLQPNARVKAQNGKKMFNFFGKIGNLVYGMAYYLENESSYFTDGKFHYYRVINPFVEDNLNQYLDKMEKSLQDDGSQL